MSNEKRSGKARTSTGHLRRSTKNEPIQPQTKIVVGKKIGGFPIPKIRGSFGGLKFDKQKTKLVEIHVKKIPEGISRLARIATYGKELLEPLGRTVTSLEPISEKTTVDSTRNDIQRADLLHAYAKAKQGQPVTDEEKRSLTALALTAPRNLTSATQELAPPLPKRALELWPSDPSKRTETPPEFCVRVYGLWMEAGVFTRQDLKRLDPKLFASLDNWLKHNNRKAKPDPLPDGFRLLTLSEKNDRWVEQVVEGKATLQGSEVGRLTSALQRRRGKTDEPHK